MTKINKKNQKQLDDELWAELDAAQNDENDKDDENDQRNQESQRDSSHKNKSFKKKNDTSNHLQENTYIKGLVVASYGQYSSVRLLADDLSNSHLYLNSSLNPSLNSECKDNIIECVNKGRHLDPVIGDQVLITQTSVEQGRIDEITPRKNLLYRSDLYKSKAFAANIDALIWVIAPKPRFNPELLDRAIIAAHSINVPLKIVFNKSDLDASEIAPLLKIYQHLDLSIHRLSKNNRSEILQFFQQFNHQRLILLGQSGMGKSTLLNTLVPELNIKTREVSKVLNSGKHTTTHSKLYHIIHPEEDLALEIIDSPGFQLFGLHHLSLEDYVAGFAEFAPYLGQCRFNNCQHISEPGCAILQALKQEKIHSSRYQSYLRLCQEIGR